MSYGAPGAFTIRVLGEELSRLAERDRNERAGMDWMEQEWTGVVQLQRVADLRDLAQRLANGDRAAKLT